MKFARLRSVAADLTMAVLFLVAIVANAGFPSRLGNVSKKMTFEEVNAISDRVDFAAAALSREMDDLLLEMQNASPETRRQERRSRAPALSREPSIARTV
jgi:hypothetical protein